MRIEVQLACSSGALLVSYERLRRHLHIVLEGGHHRHYGALALELGVLCCYCYCYSYTVAISFN